MSMEGVESRVLAEAKAEAKKIVEEALGERDRLLKEFQDESEKALEEAVRAAEAEAAAETSRQLGRARHEGELDILRAKNEVLDEAFRRAAEGFRSVPEGEYLELMAAWLKNLPPETGGALIVSPNDAGRFSGGFLDGVNAARPDTGKFTSVAQNPKITGGFIVEGRDFVVDVTLERRARELREALAGEIARELFGNEPEPRSD